MPAASRLNGLFAVLAVLGWVVSTPALAAQAPLNGLFAPNSAALTVAGEQWLASQVALRPQQALQRIVVVALPGAGDSLQLRRAQMLRGRLASLGVAPQQVYFESGGQAQ